MEELIEQIKNSFVEKQNYKKSLWKYIDWYNDALQTMLKKF